MLGLVSALVVVLALLGIFWEVLSAVIGLIGVLVVGLLVLGAALYLGGRHYIGRSTGS